MDWRKLNPLGSVFGKIWLSFWVTLLLITMVVAFISHQVAQVYQIGPPNATHIGLLNRVKLPNIDRLASDRQEIMEELDRFNAQSSYQWYLVDDTYHLLGTPRPPRRILVMLSEMMETEGVRVGQWRQEAWMGPITMSVGGEMYRLFLRGVPALPPPNLPLWLDSQWLRGIFALFVSGAMSLVLAWSITRPIARLRRASQQLAGGDLDARVGGNVTRRVDELGGLGRDFDEMAERLQQLVAAQQRLLSNVSHELRSPLTRLQVALGIVRQRAPEELESALNRIERESDRLESLIAQVLKLSRFENAMQHMDVQKVQLDELVRHVVDDARFESRRHDLTIVDQIDDTMTLEGDPQLLHSAIDNVVRNALRFSPENSTLKIRLLRQASLAIIEIEDEGPGVPEDKLERLFDPFYRLDQSNPGAGLGLNIARHAVSAHKGSIKASNRAEGGLCIRIELPLN
ncbi:MAG: HAMP domain-containing protein [Saccharospirillum sp.]|nr:HAMP domain-containing protein [Saccharospirillum sp.]